MSQPHLLKAIFVSTGLPATNNEAGFEALTWVRVAHPVVGPQFGITHANIDIPNLETGWTKGAKGAGSGQDSSMTFATVVGDAGQTAIKGLSQAGGPGGNGSIKVVRIASAGADPATGAPVVFAQGYFHSYIETAADTTSYEGFTINFKQNDATIEGTH
jgi:hypothetical protein